MDQLSFHVSIPRISLLWNRFLSLGAIDIYFILWFTYT